MQFCTHSLHGCGAPKSRPPPPPRLIVPGWPQAASAPRLPRQWGHQGPDCPHSPATPHRRRQRSRSPMAAAWPWAATAGRGLSPRVSVSRRLPRSPLAGSRGTSAPPPHPALAPQVKRVTSGSGSAPRRALAPPSAWGCHGNRAQGARCRVYPGSSGPGNSWAGGGRSGAPGAPPPRLSQGVCPGVGALSADHWP